MTRSTHACACSNLDTRKIAGEWVCKRCETADLLAAEQLNEFILRQRAEMEAWDREERAADNSRRFYANHREEISERAKRKRAEAREPRAQ